MKKAIANNGDIVEVSDSTPTNNISGTRYLLTPAEQAEADAKDAAEAIRIPRRRIEEGIEGLENEVTRRRTREAILGVDGGWLANQESLIATERAKL